MVTYLFHKRLFLPVFCLISAIFIPLIALSLFGAFLGQTSAGYICLITISLIYIGVVMSIRLGLSKKEDCFTVNEDSVCCYHYCKGELTKRIIPFSQIIEVDYYSLGSIISWFLCLHSYVLPRCVFVTYIGTAGEETAMLGYILKKDAEKLFCNLNLVIH